MVQGSQEFCLTLKAGHSLRIACEYVWQELQGDLAVQGKILGKVDITHTALAYLLQDPIVGNLLAGFGHAIASR